MTCNIKIILFVGIMQTPHIMSTIIQDKHSRNETR